MHIILERPDQNIGMIYSLPSILDEGTYLNEMILEDFDHVSNVYKKSKDNNKPIINLARYDISTNKQRSFTAVNPLIIIENEEEIFSGAIIWESKNVTKIFDEMIIPKSFTNGKYPFI